MYATNLFYQVLFEEFLRLPHYYQLQLEHLKTKALLAKVAELERALGRKQLEVDFNNKLIELASKEVGYDIKKKHEPRPSNGSGEI